MWPFGYRIKYNYEAGNIHKYKTKCVYNFKYYFGSGDSWEEAKEDVLQSILRNYTINKIEHPTEWLRPSTIKAMWVEKELK